MLQIDLRYSALTDEDFNKIHQSLVGSPSYINSEILFNKDDKVLLIGNNNQDDATLRIYGFARVAKV